jgi:hypothetical protein
MSMVWQRPGLADHEGPLTEWQAAARTYRLDQHWPAFTFGRLVWLRAEQSEALDVPEPLGVQVLNLLRGNDIEPVVFTAPDPVGIRWVFLGTRNTFAWPDLAERLPLDVHHRWAGATVDLPPSESDHGRLTWITPPSAAPLPDLSVIADAIIRAANHPQ